MEACHIQPGLPLCPWVDGAERWASLPQGSRGGGGPGSRLELGGPTAGLRPRGPQAAPILSLGSLPQRRPFQGQAGGCSQGFLGN